MGGPSGSNWMPDFFPADNMVGVSRVDKYVMIDDGIMTPLADPEEAGTEEECVDPTVMTIPDIMILLLIIIPVKNVVVATTRRSHITVVRITTRTISWTAPPRIHAFVRRMKLFDEIKKSRVKSE